MNNLIVPSYILMYTIKWSRGLILVLSERLKFAAAQHVLGPHAGAEACSGLKEMGGFSFELLPFELWYI